MTRTGAKNIADAYPLSPLQEGMLFHSLYAPGKGMFIAQWTGYLESLNVAAFQRAWEMLVDRHAVLRTAFVWEGIDRPLQVVGHHVKVPLSQRDWRGVAEAEQAVWLKSYLEDDRTRDFKLSKAPLMRLALFHVGNDDYLFVWTAHHLLLDGWSGSILFKEFAECYSAFAEGKRVVLDPPRKYSDYIDWLQHQDTSAAEKYWRGVLKGFQAPTRLPIDSSSDRSVRQIKKASAEHVRIPVGTTERLRSVCKQTEITMNTLTQGAWAILLSRYSGSLDVVFGTTVAGRPADLPGVESMVGVFINTLAVRACLDSSDWVDSWLQGLQEKQVASRRYEYSPLVKVQEWSELPRGTPLFETLAVYQNFPVVSSMLGSSKAASALKVKDYRGIEQGAYPLDLLIVPGSEISLDLHYDGERFDGVTVLRLLDHLQSLLRAMSGRPRQRISSLSILSDAEMQQLRTEWNDTQAREPGYLLVHMLFEAQVERTPERVGLFAGGSHHSYGELNCRANRLARYLRVLRVGSGQPVGICLDRSFEMAIGFLAVLKAGGAYVPLDPSYPKERLAFMLRASGATVLLTQERYAGLVSATAVETVRLDSDWHRIAKEQETNPRPRADARDLAYVLFTSGSTGRPKGVGVPHAGLAHYTQSFAKGLRLTCDDRMLQFASISFDVVLEELFPPWITGGCVVIEGWDSLPSGEDLCRDIERHSVTALELPTAYWEQWVETLVRSQRRPAASLRCLIIGGERASLDSLADWERFGIPLINVYGLTEGTITSALFELPAKGVHRPDIELPIGRPIDNTEAYVLDYNMEPLPAGLGGELYIGGAGLARGYVGRPDLTAERFVPHLFDGPGARLYKTGDRARHLLSGDIECLGRIDHQTKMRGYRIEMGEIEDALREIPAVRQAVVVVQEGEAGTAVGPGISIFDDELVMQRLYRLTPERAEGLLADVASLPEDAIAELLAMEMQSTGEESQTKVRRHREFDISVTLHTREFIRPPRPAQRNGLLRRALDEFSDDLRHLDEMATRMVPGSARPRLHKAWRESAAEYDGSQLVIQGQQVMQDWERPLMKAMAEIVTESHGDVLELGFGMGISATYIQEFGVRSYTVVEANEGVAEYFERWKRGYPGRDIRLIHGRWHDVADKLGTYDGVFFDTVPINEEEYVKEVIDNVVMAEDIFPTTARCLRRGGVFTWYTNEVDSFSRRHQRLALRYFSSITLSLVKPLRPPHDCHYWQSDSMVVVKAVK
jgi:amino acid adenylation domain-containing protein